MSGRERSNTSRTRIRSLLGAHHVKQVPMLVAAVLGLLVGPVLSSLWPHGRGWRAGLDGLSLALVGGLVVLHLLPHALEHGGLPAIVAGLLAAIAPSLLERWGVTDASWSLFALAALTVHATLDGAALATASEPVSALGLAVVAHRLPVGLVVFSEAAHEAPPARGWVAVGVLILATVGGWAVGAPLADLGPSWLGGVLEAVVAGALLHVLLEEATPQAAADPCCHHETADEITARHWGAGGATLGVSLVALYPLFVVDPHVAETVSSAASRFLALALDSAPALLVGYLLAGLVIALMTPARAAWLSGGSAAGQALRGVAFGLPLPVCSCGVLPLYASLVERGVPATAALAFLVATPELGLDAVLLSLPLLGLPLTAARVAAAFLVAVGVAWWVGRSLRPGELAAEPAPSPLAPLPDRVKDGLRYGFGELVDHTMPWVVLGLAIAAVAEPLLAHPVVHAVPAVAQVPLFALIGIPVYVCATGATPIAAMAVYAGVSPGAALAFLLAGPATNITTFGVLTQLHSRRTAVRFGLAVLTGAVLIGWGIDLLGVPGAAAPLPAHGHGPRPFAWLSLITLAVLTLGSLWRLGPRGLLHQITQPVHG